MREVETVHRTLVDLPPSRGRKTPNRVFVQEWFSEKLKEGTGEVVAAGRVGGTDLLVQRHDGDLYWPLRFVDEDGVPTRTILFDATDGEGDVEDEPPLVHVATLDDADLAAYRAVRRPYEDIVGSAMILDGHVVRRRDPQDLFVVVDGHGRREADMTVGLRIASEADTWAVTAPLSALGALATFDPETNLTLFDVDAFHVGDRLDPGHYRNANVEAAAGYMRRIGDNLSPELGPAFLRTYADAMEALETRDPTSIWTRLAALTRQGRPDVSDVVPSQGIVTVAMVVAGHEEFMATFDPVESEPDEPDPVVRPSGPRP